MNETDLITVCDKCLTATCWQGHFMCDEAQNAGITQKTVAELRVLGYENPSHWEQDADVKAALTKAK